MFSNHYLLGSCNEGYILEKNQIIPTFFGWVIQLHGIESCQAVLTFLTPLPCLITGFSFFCKTMHRSKQLSKISNVKYTYIMVNVSAAEKYIVIWNNLEKFDFHAFAHFGNYGKFVTKSYFKEIVFNARMCSYIYILSLLVNFVNSSN